MSGPVHIDIDGTLNAYRAMAAKQIAAARVSARNASDHAHIDAQAHFHELLLLASRLKMEAENKGMSGEHIAKGMGVVFGTMQAQNLLNFIQEGTGDLYQSRYMRTVEVLTLGGKEAHEHIGSVSVQTVRGGHA